MSYVIITPEQMQTSRWSGGSTTQMMIFPAGSSYRNRDFRFRISSAVVEDAVSVFTKLDGVERFLTVLEGKISLRTGASEPQELNAYDTIHFHGGDDTVSEGQCVDFNLMLRGCRGAESVFLPGQGFVLCGKAGAQHAVLSGHGHDAEAWRRGDSPAGGKPVCAGTVGTGGGHRAAAGEAGVCGDCRGVLLSCFSK